MPAALEIIRDPNKAATLLSPARMQLLERLADPDSASGLSRQLGIPRQKINYHLGELESAGLVDFVEERRRGNCLERVVRASARSYIISPEALGALGQEPKIDRDRFSAAYLIATAIRTIRDLITLRSRADRAKKTLATLTLETEIRFASAATRLQFTEELTRTVAHLAAKYHDDQAPAGRKFCFFAGAYPAITKQESDDTTESLRLE
jgi:DNA-binding transcriptional ArsR family regulator